jgi:hypothetical protein
MLNIDFCHKLSKVIRAATNYIRHAHEWRWNDKRKTSDAKVLKSLGIDYEREDVPLRILDVIGAGDYFAFEDACSATLTDIFSYMTLAFRRRTPESSAAASGPRH